MTSSIGLLLDAKEGYCYPRSLIYDLITFFIILNLNFSSFLDVHEGAEPTSCWIERDREPGPTHTPTQLGHTRMTIRALFG